MGHMPLGRATQSVDSQPKAIHFPHHGIHVMCGCRCTTKLPAALHAAALSVMKHTTCLVAPLLSIISNVRSARYSAVLVLPLVSTEATKTAPLGVSSRKLMRGRPAVSVQPSDVQVQPVSSRASA